MVKAGPHSYSHAHNNYSGWQIIEMQGYDHIVLQYNTSIIMLSYCTCVHDHVLTCIILSYMQTIMMYEVCTVFIYTCVF